MGLYRRASSDIVDVSTLDRADRLETERKFGVAVDESETCVLRMRTTGVCLPPESSVCKSKES